LITNIYALNIGALNFIKQALLYIKGVIGPDIIIVCDFNTLFSSIDYSDKKSTKKLHSFHLIYGAI
jgi:hypothetical protein